MKKTLITAITLSLSILLCCAFSSLGKDAWLDGKWKGMKFQVNADKGWVTELTMDSKTNTYTVNYPELGCKGKLELISIKGTTATFTEKLTAGDCVDDGHIIITKVSNKHISFTCLRDAEKRLASFSTLEKQ